MVKVKKGSKKDDVLNGTSKTDKIFGLAGNDSLFGKLGNDKLYGGGDDDELFGGAGNDKLKGGGGNDRLYGGIGEDKLKGGAGDDLLDGGDWNDTLDGGAGNDLFIGSAGADAHYGGDGIDTVSFAASAGDVEVDLLGGFGAGAAQGDTFVGIENVEGTAFNDHIEGDGAANLLLGLAGKDTLYGGGGDDRLEGGDGDDLMRGGDGADIFIGGAGSDTVDYFSAAIAVTINLAIGATAGAAADDSFDSIEVISGSNLDDNINGDGSANIFFGNGGGDTLRGDGGDDLLFGGAGIDSLDGGAGNDRLRPDDGSDVTSDWIEGDTGIDTVDYSQSSSPVTAYLAAHIFSEGAAGDIVDGVENVFGSSFNDHLQPHATGYAFGDWGDDIIFDAGVTGGQEILRGGRGADTLIDDFFGSEDGTRDIFFLEAGLGMDTIYGFSQSAGESGDRLWLNASTFSGLIADAQGMLADGQLFNNLSGSPTGTGAQLIYDKDDKILWFDGDGTLAGVAVQVATIVGGSTELNKSDFVLVNDIFF